MERLHSFFEIDSTWVLKGFGAQLVLWSFLTLFLERSGITFPGEGGSICPTYTQGSFSALEPPKGQKSCFHISLDHFQLIWAFLGFFFHKSQKNAKIENLTKKLLKNEWNFKILQFLTYINILYIKGKHFSCRIQFHKEKVWFFARKIKKNQFFKFFIEIEADQLSLTKNFWKL